MISLPTKSDMEKAREAVRKGMQKVAAVYGTGIYEEQLVVNVASLLASQRAALVEKVSGAVAEMQKEVCGENHVPHCEHEIPWDWKGEIIDTFASPTDGTLWPVPKEVLITFCEKVRDNGFDEGKQAYFDVDQVNTFNACRSKVLSVLRGE